MMALGIAASMLIGVLLGLLGGGGSILTVPLLVYILDVEPKTAIAMSLLVVGLTSISAVVMHARAGRVRWRTAFIFGPAGMVGAFAGGRVAGYIPPTFLLLLFVGVMVAAAVAMLRRKEAAPAPGASEKGDASEHLPMARVLVQGVAVGALSGLVGAGGGFLIVPALVLVGLPTQVAVGTSLVVIAMQCAAGLLGHLGHVQLPWGLTGAVLATAISGSFVGGRLAGRVSPAALRKGFAWFVLSIATLMLAAETPPELRARLTPMLATPWPWLVLIALVGAVAVPFVLSSRGGLGRSDSSGRR
ncbi:MAG TPA: sulfite exporter TauE/SafE family protein [Myxococcaceae bacterium]|nr:sulfite exporter TauE/SafE family protein [Myxococcaceae bacterium]